MEAISVAEAKSRFSELLSRASAGERFVIQRRERAVAALIGAGDLKRLERAEETVYELARALGQTEEIINKVRSGEMHRAMLAFGLWRDQPEFDNLTEEIYANRRNQLDRPDVDL